MSTESEQAAGLQAGRKIVSRRSNFRDIHCGKLEKEDSMPYVNIKVTDEGVSPQQKTQLIQGATDLLARVLGKNPATTVVVIEEIPTDNWGIGGESVTVRRARGQ